MISDSTTRARAPLTIRGTLRQFALPVAIAIWLAVSVQAQTLYHITYIGDLPGGLVFSVATDINERGQVVGFSNVAGGAHAFLWNAENGMQDLGELPGGSTNGQAEGLNNHGDVVGGSETASGRHPFIWIAGNLRDLGGTGDGNAFGVNDNGWVVGEGATGSGRAFLWTSGGGLQDLTTLVDPSDTGWILRTAYGINDAGQIVGAGTNPDGKNHAFLWMSGQVQDLGDLPGEYDLGRAVGINNRGDVVGQGQTGLSGSHAFLWTTADGMQDLGDLSGGRGDSAANDINDIGQVVGTEIPPTGQSRGFIWTIEGGMQDLNSLLDASSVGWRITGASAINNAGQIVASARNVDGRGGAILLTPIPEPSTWGLVVVAIMTGACEMTRRRHARRPVCG